MSDLINIIDGHMHVASMRFTPIEFMEGVVDNMVEQSYLVGAPLERHKVLDRLIASYQDHQADTQIREMHSRKIKNYTKR